jgi:hypothetical protein
MSSVVPATRAAAAASSEDVTAAQDVGIALWLFWKSS